MSFVLTSCALLLALLVGVVVDTSSHKLDLIEATPAEPDCRHFVAIRPGGLPVLLPAVRPPLSMSVQAFPRHLCQFPRLRLYALSVSGVAKQSNVRRMI
jgi:hypothetical protein